MKRSPKSMYKRLSNFVDINNVIYSLQFVFLRKYSTSHVLINLTGSITQYLDEGNFDCGIFVALQKAFDTIDHKILLHKLEYYEIRGVCNNWFKSYLSDRKKFVSINRYNFDLMPVDYCVSQGSILGPLLFLICDMKHLNNWLSVNKISLNVKKNELVISKSLRKVLLDEIKTKLRGKSLYPLNSIKHLGVHIERFLRWHDQINSIALKLNRANALLLKIRNNVNMKTLRNIYFAIFDAHLSYSGSLCLGSKY